MRDCFLVTDLCEAEPDTSDLRDAKRGLSSSPQSSN